MACLTRYQRVFAAEGLMLNWVQMGDQFICGS